MTLMPKSTSNRPLWRLNRREQTVAIVCLAFLLMGAWLPGRIAVATSASLDHRVFFLMPAASKVELGDYLVFRHRDLSHVQHGLRQDNEQMIKKVGCLPGGLLTADAERNFTCNSTVLGKALDADSKGRQLPQFIVQRSGPGGQAVHGRHPSPQL